MIPSKITDPRKLERRLPGRYRVVGARAYRDHAPGSEFVAFLEPGPEGRAIRRGDIRVLERIELTVTAIPYVLPSAQTAKIPRNAEARAAARRPLTTTLEGR